ncbi:MAG: class I SAM-dependent methyltransferase [Treponema sp.]|jgi:2-polyprenyl-3-methyl-5-hydroxy-6-metoxy-1,4-benzoquinol methylase|nr:class I SAM-dependent methyltransferase [Treponema sp.]
MNKRPPLKTWSTPAVDEEKALVPCAICGGNLFDDALECEGFSYVRCAGCGLVQMNPQPLPARVRRRYGGQNGFDNGGFGEEYLSYELSHEKPFLALQLLALEDAGFWDFEKALKNRLTLSGGKAAVRKMRVLDAGCATGALLGELQKSGWECSGCELSIPQAKYAREKRGLDVRPFPLEACRYPESYFDAVLASHLIEHLNDPASFVREVYRILSPGGVFIVTTPNIDGFQARLFKSRWRSAIFDHLYLFSVKTLKALLERNNFIIEKIVTWGGLAAGTAPALIKRAADKSVKLFGAGDVMLFRVYRTN